MSPPSLLQKSRFQNKLFLKIPTTLSNLFSLTFIKAINSLFVLTCYLVSLLIIVMSELKYPQQEILEYDSGKCYATQKLACHMSDLEINPK